MSIRIIKYLTPLLQPLYRKYLSRPRSYRFRNILVWVSPGVFFPGFIFSTKIFLKYIEHLDIAGKRFLEIGAGSGIISVLAARKKALVTATDINPAAVQDIRDNAVLNKVELTVIESDLFEKIPKSAFDFIIIVPPYYPKDPGDYREMAWFCGKNFEFFEKLFRQLPEFYSDDAQVLMILSEDCDISRIRDIGASNGLGFHLLYQKRKLGEWNYIYSISMNDRKMHG
jgi:release factor glutamine methyltransferase